MEHLKDEILKYLTEKDIKPYELEDSVGVPRATIYRFLSGKRELFLSTAIKIHKYMEQNA